MSEKGDFMIFGNISKIRNYDIDILEKEMENSFSDTDIISMQTLSIIKDFAIKYKVNEGDILRFGRVIIRIKEIKINILPNYFFKALAQVGME